MLFVWPLVFANLHGPRQFWREMPLIVFSTFPRKPDLSRWDSFFFLVHFRKHGAQQRRAICLSWFLAVWSVSRFFTCFTGRFLRTVLGGCAGALCDCATRFGL